MKCFITALLAAAALVTSTSAATQTIAVIPKGTTHVYWKSVEAGAREAAKELGVHIVWKGPLKEDDRAGQISLVDQFVGSGVSAIVLAPLDANALRGSVESAHDHHIPVVIIDSALNAKAGTDYSSFVATDNYHGGQIAGEELAKLLHDQGKVVLLRYLEGSASTLDREQGFLDTMKKYPKIHVIVSNRFAGATASSAQDTAMNLIDKIRQADGIFCSNEPSTFGMLLALRQNGLSGKKKFVGFDATPNLIKALKRGDLNALVSQNPKRMGYLGVVTAVKVLRGQPIKERIDTGCELITPQNINTPRIQKLLNN